MGEMLRSRSLLMNSPLEDRAHAVLHLGRGVSAACRIASDRHQHGDNATALLASSAGMDSPVFGMRGVTGNLLLEEIRIAIHEGLLDQQFG